MVNNRKVIIDDAVKLQLREAYKYIRKQSFQNAEKVKGKILESIKKLAANPEHHPPDKFCLDNDSRFRAYEVYKYRITYHIDKDTIYVVRIRHSKMDPLPY